MIPANNEPTNIDVLSWLSRATLDIIGLAGFNYQFVSLNPKGEPNALNQAMSQILSPTQHISPALILRQISPIFRVLVSIQGTFNEMYLAHVSISPA